MGSANSKVTYTNNRAQSKIIEEIHSRAKRLSDKYSQDFLDENFCDRVALIYNDRLAQFRKQDIDNVQYIIGIVNNNQESKTKVCKMIIDHYIKRIKLIAKIEVGVDFCLSRIYALTIGPRCNGQPEVFKFEECRNKGGQWVETVLLPDDQLLENKAWYQIIHDMQAEYIGYLKKLSTILRQMEDFDETINNEKLDTLDLEVDRMNQMIKYTTYERYRMALVTPTYTAEQIRQRKLKEDTMRGDYAAKQSALRVSNGLPPLRGGSRLHNL